MSIRVSNSDEISYEKRLDIAFYKNNGKSYSEIATIVGCPRIQLSL